ncbi:MAG TPA: hypothetical protein VGJ70_05270 [Solirubrobacteraceae bacterium]|jgi:hypothetical protein
MSPYASGVARFNQILAERLGVPHVGLADEAARRARHPLVSLKVSELDESETRILQTLLDRLDRGDRWSAFLHAFADGPLERRLVAGATVVHAGNAEVAAQVVDLHPRVEDAWAPGLILDQRRFNPTAVSIFSFGMAHKVRADMFARLRELLERGGETYALYMSNANHATATLRDAEEVYEEMRRVFPTGLFFMGNLSDVAIHNHLCQATYFAAFFPGGVRANNTSVLSAMEHGAVVITNLDEHSPPSFVHMDNVIDIEQCDRLPTDPLVLARLRLRALETARELSWERLVARLHRAAG